VVDVDRFVGSWMVESIFFFLVCRFCVLKDIGFFIVVRVSSWSRWFWMMLWVVLLFFDLWY